MTHPPIATAAGPVYDAATTAKLLGFTYDEAALAAFGPPLAAVEGLLTFFDPGWSILKLRVACRRQRSIFYRQNWYDVEDFAKKEEKAGYRQLRLEAVKDSFRKTFAEQQRLLPKDEEVPTARSVVMGVVLHYLATGERLFPTYWVRCSDTDSGGYRVFVGFFDAYGLYVASSGMTTLAALSGWPPPGSSDPCPSKA